MLVFADIFNSGNQNFSADQLTAQLPDVNRKKAL